MAKSFSEPASTPGPSARRGAWAALAAGIVAATMTWAVGEVTIGFFPQKTTLDPLKETADLAGYKRIVVKNASITHGLQGAILGLSLGVAGGIASRASTRSRAIAGGTGVLLGGLLGAVGSYGAFTVYNTLVDANAHDMIPPLLTHAGVAALLGASGGLAFGLGLGGRGRAIRGMVGGLVGGAIGAVLCEVALAVVFPDERTGAPIASAWTPRLMAHVLIDLLACLGAGAVVESAATRSGRDAAAIG